MALSRMDQIIINTIKDIRNQYNDLRNLQLDSDIEIELVNRLVTDWIDYIVITTNRPISPSDANLLLEVEKHLLVDMSYQSVFIGEIRKRIKTREKSEVLDALQITNLLFSRYKYCVDENIEAEHVELTIKELVMSLDAKDYLSKFSEYYTKLDFSFSDYSDSIKNILLCHHYIDQDLNDTLINILCSSIKMAGSSLGKDYSGLKTIENYSNLINDVFLVEELVKMLEDSLESKSSESFEQIRLLVAGASIDMVSKMKILDRQLVLPMIQNAIETRYYRLSNRGYDVSDLTIMVKRNEWVNVFTNLNSDLTLRLKFSGLDEDSHFVIRYGEDVIKYTIYHDNVHVYLLIDNNGKKSNYNFMSSSLSSSVFNVLREPKEKKLESTEKRLNSNNLGHDDIFKHRIEYLWINDFKVLNNKAFSFSSKYRVERNGLSFTLSENVDSIDHLLYHGDHKISMVNALVGENGSGKTTLIELMSRLSSSSFRNDEKYEFLIIYEFNGKLHAYCSSDSVEVDGLNVIRENTIPTFLKRSKSLYYTPISEVTSTICDKKDRSIIDLSSCRNIEEDGTSFENVKRLVFLSKMKEVSKSELDFNLPHKVSITVYEGELFNIDDNISYLDNLKKNYNKELVKLIFELNVSEPQINVSELFCLDKDNNMTSVNLQFNPHDVDIISLLKRVNKHSLYYQVNIGGFSAGELMRLTLFSKLYWASLDASLRIALYDHANVDELYDNTLLIFLDEPDVFLHPSWKLRLINELKWFVERIYKENDNVGNIQLFVTSNSPFMMTDIPLEHTIQLGKKGDSQSKYISSQTFAQNIHDILNDSFFLHNGSMGDYSKALVKEVIACLDEEVDRTSYHLPKDIKVDELYKIIGMIGEPMIKNHLYRMFDKKYGENSKAAKIKRLEAELALLKGEDTSEVYNAKN